MSDFPKNQEKSKSTPERKNLIGDHQELASEFVKSIDQNKNSCVYRNKSKKINKRNNYEIALNDPKNPFSSIFIEIERFSGLKQNKTKSELSNAFLLNELMKELNEKFS